MTLARFAASRVALGLAICAALLLAAQLTWSGSAAPVPVAWVLLGMIAAFSLSGSV